MEKEMKGQNFSFMKEMVPMIISGRKIITNRIATPFRQKLEVGGIMHLFTGMRTANCRKIGTAKVLDKVYWFKHQIPVGDAIILWDAPLEGWTWENFAYRDGFNTYIEFYDYFKNRGIKADLYGFACYKFQYFIGRDIEIGDADQSYRNTRWDEDDDLEPIGDDKKA